MFHIQGPSACVILQKIRISLKSLETLSYSFTKVEDLNEIFKRVKQLEKDVEELVPKDSGIILRPDKSLLVTAKKIKLKYKQYQIWKISRQYSKLNKCHKSGRQRVIRKRKRINYTYDVSTGS